MMTSFTRWVLAHKRLVTLTWVVVTLVGIATVGREGYETNSKIQGHGSAQRCEVKTPPKGFQFAFELGRIGRVVTWGFLWLMLALKIPLIGLICIVWWAIKQEPEETPSSDEDGGVKRNPSHPRKPFPRRPRRGPHGDPAPLPPARVRTTQARARTFGH